MTQPTLALAFSPPVRLCFPRRMRFFLGPTPLTRI
jgi:hypothetical protein